MYGRTPSPAGTLVAAHATFSHPAQVTGHRVAHVARGRKHLERLDVSGGLAESAILVEVAPHELGGPVVVSVHYGGTRVVDLRPAGREHVRPERLIL